MKTQYKHLIGLPLVAGLLLLAGCIVTSVYPYYTDKDVVVDDALIGKWADIGETNVTEKHWEFVRTNGQAYMLYVRDGDETTEFRAHLFKLKNRRFIDAQPTKRVEDFIPPHYLLQVHQLDATAFEMSVMDSKWLEELLKEKPSAIAHLWVDGDEGKNGKLVLTADTPKLQSFVLKYAADTNAFAEPFKMVKH